MIFSRKPVPTQDQVRGRLFRDHALVPSARRRDDNIAPAFILSDNHSPNTNSIDAVEVFFSSGIVAMMVAGCRAPTSTATYCLPLTE